MKKKILFCLCSFFFLLAVGAGIAAYMIPVELHAIYQPEGPLYQYDVIDRNKFEVYTTSRLGKVEKVEDFTISECIAQPNHNVMVVDSGTGLVTDSKICPVSVISSYTLYDGICYEDEVKTYEPDFKEMVLYEDGRLEEVDSSYLSVSHQVDEKQENICISAKGKHDSYQMEVPIIMVESITTKDQVSVEHSLNAEKLDLTIHYSDGRTVKAQKKQVTSTTIKHPKEGKNRLTCKYNGKEYIVSVKAYDPAPKVSFEGYGSYKLKYSEEYYVEGAERIDSYVGTVYFADHRETFYSRNVSAGTSYYIPGEHVAEDGTIRDEDGFICLAADYGFKSPHEIVLTSLGPGKIYDTGCAYGVIDIYCTW